MHDEGKRIFKALNIVYRPVRKIYQIVNYYFSVPMRQAYHMLRDRGKRGMESTAAQQCFDRNKFLFRRSHWKIAKNFARHSI